MKGKSLIIIIGIIVLLAFPLIGSYNSLITSNENVDAAWALAWRIN